MSKEKPGKLSGNEKLIRRAAIKYRNWMISQSQRPSEITQKIVLNHLKRVSEKSAEMNKWAERFFKGITPSTQSRIINPGVYKKIATDMVPDLGHNLIIHTQSAIGMLKDAVENNTITPLSLEEAINEIKIISEAWQNVTFRADQLSVQVDHVTLSDDQEEVELGSFKIHLDLTNPMNELTVESLDMIKSSEKGLYHPHVDNDGYLCQGDGEDATNDALYQGRLEDYFRIIETILRTYGSPYEDLSGWYKPNHEGEFWCEKCEEWRDDDNRICCEGCSSQYCDSCANGNCCAMCEEWRCKNCYTTCKDCDATICFGSGCHDGFENCNDCNKIVCSSCLIGCTSCENQFCQSCPRACAYCANTVCDECKVECNNCKNYYCPDCSNETCNECEKSVCKSCNDNECEHCGVSVCSSCNDRHNCLLEKVGVNNE